MNRFIQFLSASLIGLLLSHDIGAQNSSTPSASLAIQNRSGYSMDNSIWLNGENCSGRLLPKVDINNTNTPVISIPAGKSVAVGVAIYEMRGKSPVVCDYILSFALDTSRQYRLEYDVHDRRCYGQLFRQEGDVYKLVVNSDAENLKERFPEFGWDQYEPGCAKE